MVVTRGLRHPIQTGRPADELQHRALGDGMCTLRQEGIEKVLAGVTTIDEVRANSWPARADPLESAGPAVRRPRRAAAAARSLA